MGGEAVLHLLPQRGCRGGPVRREDLLRLLRGQAPVSGPVGRRGVPSTASIGECGAVELPKGGSAVGPNRFFRAAMRSAPGVPSVRLSRQFYGLFQLSSVDSVRRLG